jgi:hypothetical protein
MQGRASRLAIAILLTAGDFAIFRSCSGVIWQTWGHTRLARADLVGLLAIWIAPAAVIWFHVSNDLLQTLHQRNCGSLSAQDLVPREPRRDSDV